MNTDHLIQQLTTGLGPTSQGAPVRRLALAAAAGALVSLVAMLVLIGPRPDLQAALGAGPFWMKAAYTAGLTAGGFFVAERLSRPGVSAGWAWAPIAALTLLALGMGCLELATAPAPERMHIWMGHSWNFCLPRIVGLSVPVFAAVAWAMRGAAPTRLRLAGFAAGLLAGGAGATVYGLSCVESTAAFMASWYSLGILMAGALGALLGPRLLRW